MPDGRREWLALLNEVEALRAAPTFTKAHATMTIGAGGSEASQDPRRRSPRKFRKSSSVVSKVKSLPS